MRLIPSAFDDAHGLNPWLRRLAPWFVLAMLPVLVFYQQFLLDLHSRKVSKPPAEIARVEEPDSPGIGGLIINSKFAVKQKAYAESEGGRLDEDSVREVIDYLDLITKTRVDRLRVAIVAGELLGPEIAANRLDVLRRETEPGSDFGKEASILFDWYNAIAQKKDPKVESASREWIIARQEWFGQLAFSHGKPITDDLRWDVASGFEAFAAFSGVMVIFQFVAAIAGGALLVVALVMFATRRLEFVGEAPAAPSHIYYEAFGLFSLLFLLVLTIAIFTLGETGSWVVVLDQAALWCSLLAILWPRLRGISRMELADDMGFNKGAGWMSELAVGAAVFVVSLPLEWLVRIIVGQFSPEQQEEPIGVPMFDAPLTSSWVMVILSVAGASIWAPIVEEVMFRGTLMTALRSRLGPYSAAAVTAVAFGVYHPYGLAGILPVAVGGFVFGVTKAWRGSLIAPIFAHFLWNTLIGVTEVGTIALID